MKKTNLKSKLLSAKSNGKKKGAADQRQKYHANHRHDGNETAERNAALGRRGRLVVPIGLQTVLAVVICCSVFLVVGLIFYGAQQMEIQDLKKELKAYVADGLVPAGSMDSSVTLNIDAIGSRVDNLEARMNLAKEGSLSNEELLWIGTELNAVQAESQILNDILNDIEADKDMRKSYADTIQGPIVVLQEAYATLSASGSSVGGDDDSTGAVGDTGAFSAGSKMEQGMHGLVVVLVVVVLVLVVFLLRHKWLPLISRRQKKAKDTKKRDSSGNTVKKQPQKKAEPMKNGKMTHDHPFAEEKGKQNDEVSAEKDVASEQEPPAELSEEEAFLAEAAALQRMAAEEREKAQTGSAMAEPSAEDLLAFDASVASQEELVEEDDPLFRKDNEE